MRVIYVDSNDAAAGKTAFIMAVARRFQGCELGYWKPLCWTAEQDTDAMFARDLLGLGEDTDILAPAVLVSEAKAERQRLAQTFDIVAKGKDVLLVESPGALFKDPVGSGVLLHALHPVLNPVAAVFVARYRGSDLAEDIVAARQSIAPLFTGAIINAVPPEHRWFVADRVRPALDAAGVVLLAVIPEEPSLTAMTVRELAFLFDAEVLACAKHPAMDVLFDSVMFGSMSAEDGQLYFSRKSGKLVVTRGDRPDVHMAALATSTRCLLLTGGYPSYPFVLDKAEESAIPVLSVNLDMQSTIDRLDSMLVATRASSATKVDHFATLLDAHFDWQKLE